MLEGRAKRLIESLPSSFEAALIGTPVNRFYLLDFDAHDAGALLLLPGRLVYLIDSRYFEVAQATVQGAEVRLTKDVHAQLRALLDEANARRVMLEDGITLAVLAVLKEKIPNAEYDISNTLSKALGALRTVKDAGEMARMCRAQVIADACFAHMLSFICPGQREVDLALEIDTFMRKNGAEAPAFDTICVAGRNSSRPHGVPGQYRLQTGDFITMDFGARVDGYCCDMTRTVALGEPGEEKRRVYETVLKAHLASIAAAKAGCRGNVVDKAAREIIEAAGYGDAFGHGLGHAVGIEVHEEPRFSPACLDEVPAGAVMTVEPGIYLPGRFGCRIEDMVRITQNGCEPFPKSPKELIVL